MTKIITSIFLTTCLLICGCVEKDDLCCGIQETNSLKGTWLLYEYGYSPGAGYTTEKVAAEPPQTVSFGDREVSSTVNGWERFKYYRINGANIALHEEDPDIPGIPSSGIPTYSFKFQNDTLILNFRGCIEGCHLAFKKTDSSE